MGDWTQTIATIASMLGVGVALLAYLTRQFNRVNDRLDKLDARLQNVERRQDRFDERLTQVESRLDERISQVESRLDERLTRVESRFDERLTQVESRFDERLTQVEDRLDRHDERNEQGFQAIRGDLQELAGDVQNVEIEQARMLGFLEGRGVMGKAPAEAEGT